MRMKQSTVRGEITPTGTSPTQSTQEGGFWPNLKIAIELLAKLLPGLALLIAILLFRPELSDFLSNASKVEVFGFKLEKGEFDRRLQAAGEKLGDQRPSPSPSWTDVPFRKLRLAAPLLKGMKLLWVDDHPENNFYLRRILSELGVDIVIALNNQEGLEAIKRGDFAMVISDFGRDPPLTENGGELAQAASKMSYDAPFLFYTADPSRLGVDVPRELATNDPSALLSTIAELAFQRAR